jgi:TetR/AcrR family fatty acid metabolism transcriptional regulator
MAPFVHPIRKSHPMDRPKSKRPVTKKKTANRAPKSDNNRTLERRNAIMEGALKVFGEHGFEETTISAISKAAGVSDATVYEYFSSKEEILFSIPLRYTEREIDRMREIGRYIHSPQEKIRVIIQAYLEFYETNRLYTSVALLTLKGNRNFLQTEAYKAIREASRSIVEAFNEGVEKGVFRDDIDPHLVRNLVLGFIEHLTVQWLLTGRPEGIANCRDAIFDMVLRAISKTTNDGSVEIKGKAVTLVIRE